MGVSVFRQPWVPSTVCNGGHLYFPGEGGQTCPTLGLRVPRPGPGANGENDSWSSPGVSTEFWVSVDPDPDLQTHRRPCEWTQDTRRRDPVFWSRVPTTHRGLEWDRTHRNPDTTTYTTRGPHRPPYHVTRHQMSCSRSDSTTDV